ncbi:ADP-ribosylglycohydrolase family protein [Microseira wollei]|nr:ADP-ribosylglycohydrolase family protein [Microseira wollei]
MGEIWGAYGESWQLGQPQSTPPSGSGRLVVKGTEGLIRRGRLDLADWQESAGENSGEASVNPGKSPARRRKDKTKSASKSDGVKGYGAIISAVPVALFFHEDEAKLRQNLQQVADVWQDDSVLKDGTLAIGYAIASALKEKLNRDTLIPQTISYLDAETPLVNQLRQVQTLLEQGAPKEMALNKLIPRQTAPPANFPVALAFYCFLSTIEDLRLSVLRAARCPQAQVTCAIAGAISGAYNSVAGIPPAWRLALEQQKGDTSPLATLWGINSEAELLRLAARLLATWSGVYDAEKFLIDPSQVFAVGAPQTIKPR